MILLLATALAAVMAYGTSPFWAQFDHGFQLIMMTRRFQWPTIAVVLLLCVALIVWVVSGKRRAWWLVGLAPVLALFAHRFATDPSATLAVLDDPPLVSADQATFLQPDDFVIGVSFNGEDFAYPFAEMFDAPVVMQAAHDRKFILIWSPFANRAVAASVDRTLKARELEAVSMPANILLLYNGRLGQFINGVTGRTMDGKTPDGFERLTPTCKTTWRIWRALHPETSVLAVAAPPSAPRTPVLPFYPMPPMKAAVASSDGGGAAGVGSGGGPTGAAGIGGGAGGPSGATAFDAVRGGAPGATASSGSTPADASSNVVSFSTASNVDAHPSSISGVPPAPTAAASSDAAAARAAALAPTDGVIRVALIACTQPAAVPEASIAGGVVNTDSGPTPLLIFRQRLGSSGPGALRVFSRELPGDLAPRFRLKRFTKHPEASLTDADSKSVWTADGHAIDGPLKGDALRPINVDDDVYWNVVGPWMPDVTLVIPKPEPVIIETDAAPATAPPPKHHHKKKPASASVNPPAPMPSHDPQAAPPLPPAGAAASSGPSSPVRRDLSTREIGVAPNSGSTGQGASPANAPAPPTAPSAPVEQPPAANLPPAQSPAPTAPSPVPSWRRHKLKG